jgi:hypothetical protein
MEAGIPPVKERSHFQPFIDGTLDDRNADFLVNVNVHKAALPVQSQAPVVPEPSVPEEPADEENPRVQQKFLNLWVLLSILFVILLLFLAYLRFEVIW